MSRWTPPSRRWRISPATRHRIPHAPGRYASIEKTLADYGETHAVIVHLNDVFSIPRYLMGYENLLMAIAAEPELVSALVDLSVDVNLAMAREVASRGVQIVYTGDDFAGDTGPLMSPAHFRELFYPGLCRVMKGYKDLGLSRDQAHRRDDLAPHGHDRGLRHRLPGSHRPDGGHGPRRGEAEARADGSR